MLATSRLWRRVTTEVAAEFPDVELDHRLVDRPAPCTSSAGSASFDVIVTENLFGDILSDEASVVAGSLGMLPSASLGTRRTAHGLHGLYEPIHGSAPDIAGQDLANPIGTILSEAMLLGAGRWDGRTSPRRSRPRSGGALDDGFAGRPVASRRRSRRTGLTAGWARSRWPGRGGRIAIFPAAPVTVAARPRNSTLADPPDGASP